MAFCCDSCMKKKKLFSGLFALCFNFTHSDLENLISFSVIHRFIGLRHEIRETCSINRKQCSN